MVLEQREFPLAADKGTLGSGASPHNPRLPPQEPLHGIHGHGRGLPVQGEGAVGCSPHLRVHQLIGRGAQQDHPRGGLLLEPRGDVQGRADRRGQPLRVLPQVAHHHQTRMQPYAEGEDTPGELRAQGGGVVQALAQLEGGQHRPPGMILLGHGDTKHGREALTGRQGEGALIVVEHLLGQSHHRLQQAIPPLRAQPRRQGRRVGQRPAEDGDQLAFSVGVGARRDLWGRP